MENGPETGRNAETVFLLCPTEDHGKDERGGEVNDEEEIVSCYVMRLSFRVAFELFFQFLIYDTGPPNDINTSPPSRGALLYQP